MSYLDELMRDDVFKIGIAIVLAILVLLVVVDIVKAEEGYASYYTYKSCKIEGTSGVWTASGEQFNENDLTCAMRSRNFGKYYKITNIDNGKSVIVRHNDFGPNKRLHEKGRVVDLSFGAFKAIEDPGKGLCRVRVEKCL